MLWLSPISLWEAPITHEVALETQRIRLPHRDTADGFLGATAKAFELTLVTADDRPIESKEFAVMANR